MLSSRPVVTEADGVPQCPSIPKPQVPSSNLGEGSVFATFGPSVGKLLAVLLTLLPLFGGQREAGDTWEGDRKPDDLSRCERPLN